MPLDYTGVGAAQFDEPATLVWGSSLPVLPDTVLQLTLSVAKVNGANASIVAGLICYDETGNDVGQLLTISETVSSADWQEFVQSFSGWPAGTVSVLQVFQHQTSGSTIQVDEFSYEDVTAVVAAEAAVISAQTATTKATEAGTSATAAQSERVLAETARSGAETAETNAAASETSASGSSAAASTSASNAANSATQSGNSATAAASSASTASTKATEASQDATAAASERLAAETARSGAESAETGAVTAKNTSESAAATATSKATLAAQSETNAGNSATAAAGSASTATTKATEASQSASTATTQANTATTKAGEASTSASQAATSATNADGSASSASTSVTNAANSETAAGNSASAAATDAFTATTKAGEASTSATAANAAKLAAQTAQSNAETAETNAATSETNASGSASSASTSATNAANSNTAAGNSATAAANSASTATTKASEAGTSATSASTSANTASTKAAEASTSETNAATSATSASGSSAAAISAKDTAVAVASQGGGVLSDMTLPYGAGKWGAYSTGPTLTASEIYPTGNTWTWNLAANASGGAVISQISPLWTGVKFADGFRVEVTYKLISGTLQGAGVLLDFYPATGSHQRVQKSLEEMTPGTVITGAVMQASAVFDKPAGITTSGGVGVYFMASASLFGAQDAKNIKIYSIQVYPISVTEASVKEQASTIVDLQGNASAGYLIKAQAGSEVSLLDLIAADGAAGAVSVAKISATSILLDGTVTADHINVTSLDAISANLGTIQVGSANIADAAITNAKIGDTIQSNDFVAGSAGWRILKTGSAEFNGVVISRDQVVGSGTASIPTTQCSQQGFFTNDGVFWIDTGLSTSAWTGSDASYSAAVGRNGSNGTIFNTNNATTTERQWGWAAEVIPITRWTGGATLFIKVELWTKNVSAASGFILDWKVKKVT